MIKPFDPSAPIRVIGHKREKGRVIPFLLEGGDYNAGVRDLLTSADLDRLYSRDKYGPGRTVAIVRGNRVLVARSFYCYLSPVSYHYTTRVKARNPRRVAYRIYQISHLLRLRECGYEGDQLKQAFQTACRNFDIWIEDENSLQRFERLGERILQEQINAG